MKTAITQNTYDEVSRLVECALSADTKKQAEPFTKRLEFLRSSGGYGGYVNCVFGDLITSAKRASGKVADKERLSSFARTDLYKLEDQISNATNEETIHIKTGHKVKKEKQYCWCCFSFYNELTITLHSPHTHVKALT